MQNKPKGKVNQYGHPRFQLAFQLHYIQYINKLIRSCEICFATGYSSWFQDNLETDSRDSRHYLSTYPALLVDRQLGPVGTKVLQHLQEDVRISGPGTVMEGCLMSLQEHKRENCTVYGYLVN